MKDIKTDPGLYSLIFEGLDDGSPETIQRLKGIFIADMDLSIPEVQTILSEGRGLVCSSDDEEVIEARSEKLEAAGARVFIIGPEGSEEDLENDDQGEPEDLVAQSDAEQEDQDQEDETDLEEETDFEDEAEFELELSLDEMLEEESKPAAKKRNTVHTLDDSISLDDTLSELGIEGSDLEVAAAVPASSSGSGDLGDLSFDLDADKVAAGAEDADTLSSDQLGAISDNLEGLLDSSADIELPNKKVETSGQPQTASSAPLFELTEMGDESSRSEGSQKASGTVLPEPEKNSSDLLFDDLTLAPEEKGAELIESTVSESITDENDYNIEGLSASSSKKPTLESAKPIENVEQDSSASEGLFGGLDLDALVDGVADSATKELEKSGIEVESSSDSEEVEDLAQQSKDQATVKETIEKQETAPSTFEFEEPEAAVQEDKPVAKKSEGVEEKKPESQKQEASSDSRQSSGAVPSLGSIKKKKVVKSEETEDEVVSKSKKKASGIPNDVLAIVLVGIAILGAGNWFYFNSIPKENNLEQARLESELEKLQKLVQKKQEKEAKLKELAPKQKEYSNDYLGTENNNEVVATAEVTVNAPSVNINLLQIETPEPRELTAEEIVEEIEPFPWLKKIVIKNTNVELDQDNNFSLELPASTFVSVGGFSERFSATALIAGKFNPEQRVLHLKIIVSSDDLQEAGKAGYSIKKVSDGQYQFHAKTTLKLNAQLKSQ